MVPADPLIDGDRPPDRDRLGVASGVDVGRVVEQQRGLRALTEEAAGGDDVLTRLGDARLLESGSDDRTRSDTPLSQEPLGRSEVLEGIS